LFVHVIHPFIFIGYFFISVLMVTKAMPKYLLFIYMWLAFFICMKAGGIKCCWAKNTEKKISIALY